MDPTRLPGQPERLGEWICISRKTTSFEDRDYDICPSVRLARRSANPIVIVPSEVVSPKFTRLDNNLQEGHV
jgi:hypothetical protein